MIKIVISGLSCRFPRSDSPTEFWQNLIDGVDMVSEDDSRWPVGLFGLPARFGKVNSPTRFDAKFFGVHGKQAEKMDPQLRMLLEVSYEAFLDAGINPESLGGSRTGVFVGACFSDAQAIFGSELESITGYENTGCALSMFANRLSYFYDFHGPSQTVDTACSSSLVALDAAVKALRAGDCDVALVGGTNFVHRPSVSIAFAKLQMLSPSGTCRSFDQSGDGYARADGVGAIVVTRADLARRTYASILGSKTNSDGFTSQGITFPSGQAQAQLLRDVYREAGIDPQQVSYVEAHGTGTRAGDPQEVNAIAEVLQPQARGRENPLLIGSVKSNAGHAEGAAGLMGVIKVLLSMQNGLLPANLHFKEPNRDISALHDGSIHVVTENTPWDGGIVGVNSFGFGGTNAHVILGGGESLQGRVTSKVTSPTFLPVAGRTRESVIQLLDRLCADELDPENVKFLRGIANTDAFGVRGGVVVDENGLGSALVAERPSSKPPLYFAFPGMGSQWPKMAADLLTMPKFRASFDACAEVLSRLESPLDLHGLISNDDVASFASPTHAFVGITAVQICLVDLFRAHGVEADGFVGHSVGEIACGYADGGLSREQGMLAAYHRGRSVEDEPKTHGKMAVVERTWLDALSLANDEVTLACHNAPESVTLSGATTAIDALVSRLAAQGEQATVVNSSGIAFHSRQVRAAAPALRAALDKLIPIPQPRSARWLSSSRSADETGEDLCTAEYFIDNLTRPVRFVEALQQIPAGAIVVEMGPHSLLRSAVIGSVEDCIYVHAMRRDYDNRVEVLNALGTCWLHNIEVDWGGGGEVDENRQDTAGRREQILRVPFLGAWDHNSEWPLADLSRDVLRQTGRLDFSYEIDLNSDEYAFIRDHNINGHVLFPAVGYLWLVWRTLARIKNVEIGQLPIEFRDVRFLRATMLNDARTTELKVNYLPVGGGFEIVEGDDVVVSGKVHTGDDVTIGLPPRGSAENVPLMTGDDLYKEMRLRGYQYGETFRGVQSVSLDGHDVEVRWDGNWVTFFDCLVQTSLVREKRYLLVPTGLRRGAVDPRRQPAPAVIHGTGALNRRRVVTDAVEFEGFDLASLSVGDRAERPFLAAHKFVPYVESDIFERRGEAFARDYVDVTLHYITRQVALLAERWATEGRAVPPHVAKAINQLAPLPQSACDPDAAKVAEFAAHPNAVLLRLAQATFSQPEELLTDAMPLIVAFEEYGRVYRDDIGTSCLFGQRDLGGLLDIVMENRGTLGPVKFAEIGAGTGGLTAHILPKLRDVHDRYWVTDISSGFFDKLEQQFRPYQSVVRYSPWDIAQARPKAIDEKLDLILGSNVLHAASNIRAALANISDALDDGGFLLLHEVTDGFAAVVGVWGFLAELWDFDDPEVRDNGPVLSNEAWLQLLRECGFEVVAQRADGGLQAIFLCRKMTAVLPCEKPILFSDDAIGELQVALDEAAVARDRVVWVVGDHLDTPGLVGLSNCVRREPDGDLLRTAFIDTDSTDGMQRVNDLGDAEWAELRRRDLAMNVYKNGVWGSYRAIPIELRRQRAHEHVTLDIDSPGDLSTLHWSDAPIHRAEDFICDVHYTSLNFKDVMIATNKISAADIGHSTWRALGEFAGVTADGTRLMGCGGDLFSNRSYKTPGSMPDVWKVPDHWSLADAATVPVVYSTIYLGLVLRAGLQCGQRILIHSGSGGIGQAAIHVARSFGCEIFTTVGTDKKRAFVRKLFPDIPDSHIGSSRDTTFEDLVLDATHGEGVHLVLNALSDDKLQAGLRVLARYGQFVEIGKFDMVANTPIGMKMFLRGVSIHGVGLDNYLVNGEETVLRRVAELVREGIESGAVVPLTHTVFPNDEVESAFRYMAQGKHVGKVLLDMRSSEEAPLRSRPHFWADPEKSYLITGGLGGLGFELAGWLVDRGARYVTLSGRSGIKNGYQHYHIEEWRKQGVAVDVTQADVNTEEGTRQLLVEAQVQAPLGGIFHLAMVMKDSLWANQTQERFDEVVHVKKKGSQHLDAASRELCPALDHFVMFSSLVAGWGNAGQTSYAYGNAAMDRLCERRKDEGLPAVSIQWGPLGDVGFVSENRDSVSVESVNMGEQSLRSCLSVLDNYLLQDEPVVLSVVMPNNAIVAEAGADATVSSERTLDGLFQDVRTILGIPEDDVIPDDTTFVELGIDSLMAVEMTGKLQKDYGIRVSLAKSRALSMGQLRDLFNASSPASMGAAHDTSESSATPSHEADSGIFAEIRGAENPTEALYFVGGFATEPTSVVQEIPQPGEGSVTVVRFENSPSMDVLAEAWVDHMAALPASVKAVRIVGHSTGALIVHRLQAHLEAPEVRARLGERQIHCTTVSPPRADVFWPLRGITVDELNRASRREVLEHVRANPLFEQVDLMEPEKVRAQVRFILADHFYEKRMGKVDVTVLPSEDPLVWSGDDATAYATNLLIVPGTHDLRGLQLDEVFASGVPHAKS